MGRGLMGTEAGASAQLCSQAGAWEQGERGRSHKPFAVKLIEHYLPFLLGECARRLRPRERVGVRVIKLMHVNQLHSPPLNPLPQGEGK